VMGKKDHSLNFIFVLGPVWSFPVVRKYHIDASMIKLTYYIIGTQIFTISSISSYALLSEVVSLTHPLTFERNVNVL
jgi:hypothetical protein